MDKKQEMQRRTDEAKASLLDPDTTPILPGTRLDNIPIDQSGLEDVVKRQIETQEEAERQEAVATATANFNAAQQMADDAGKVLDEKSKAKKAKERLVEVQVQRKYTPHNVEDADGNMVPNTGVMQTVPAGTTLKLPEAEAQRALMLGIARVTDNTFNR